MSAARRASSSIAVITRCFARPRRTYFTRYATRPPGKRRRRSSESGGRAPYRHKRSRPRSSPASKRTPACRLNPSRSTASSVLRARASPRSRTCRRLRPTASSPSRAASRASRTHRSLSARASRSSAPRTDDRRVGHAGAVQPMRASRLRSAVRLRRRSSTERFERRPIQEHLPSTNRRGSAPEK